MLLRRWKKGGVLWVFLLLYRSGIPHDTIIYALRVSTSFHFVNVSVAEQGVCVDVWNITKRKGLAAFVNATPIMMMKMIIFIHADK